MNPLLPPAPVADPEPRPDANDEPEPAPPPGARDPRTMSAAAFGLFRFLSWAERAALARRPRFYSMPWLTRAAPSNFPP